MRTMLTIETTLPHSSFGAPDCSGSLNGVIRGNQADLVCNECGLIVRTVPAFDLRRILKEMGVELDIASSICPHCKAVRFARDFSELLAYECDQCGKTVTPS